MEASNAIKLTRFESILLQKLERRLADAKEAQVARESLYQMAESYRNHSQASDKRIDAFIHDCSHMTLHEIFSKHLNTDSANFTLQHPLLQSCSSYSEQLKSLLEDESKKIPKLIQEQSDWAPIRRHEMLRIAAYVHNNKCAFMQREPFNCHVIDSEELHDYLQILNGVQAENTSCRLQLIVCNEVHYTAIDLEISPTEKICCILDAYREPKAALVEQAFLAAGFTVFVTGRDNEGKDEQVQTDTRSCSIYSLSQLTSTSSIVGFLQKLKEGKTIVPGQVVNVPWTELPANIIKNSQNKQLINNYVRANRSKEELNFFFNKRGRGIEYKLAEYNNKVQNFMASAPFDKITAIACQSPFESLMQIPKPQPENLLKTRNISV